MTYDLFARYKSAMAYPDSLVFTPPYEDFGNTGIIVTMSSTISSKLVVSKYYIPMYTNIY